MADISPVDFYKIEDAIMRFWSVKEHVRLLTQRYIDYPEPMSEDEMHNHLMAIETMIELYIDAAMDTYCQTFELNEYASDEVKARREELFENFSKNRQDWHNALTSLVPCPKKTPSKKGKKK
jgi:hypothetical protein